MLLANSRTGSHSADNGRTGSQFADDDRPYSGRNPYWWRGRRICLNHPSRFRFGPYASTPLYQLITFMELTDFGCIYLYMIISSLNVHRLFLHPIFL